MTFARIVARWPWTITWIVMVGYLAWVAERVT